MLLVAGCPLPYGGSHASYAAKLRLALYASGCPQMLPHLSPGQSNYINNFGKYAEKAQVARILARLMALRLLPPRSILDMDPIGKPVVNASIGVSFSYSAKAAFCLISMEDAYCETPAALDAEYADREFQAGACLEFLLRQKHVRFSSAMRPGNAMRAIRLWTIYEAILKSGDARHPEVFTCAGNLRAGMAQNAACSIYWRTFACMGHILCVAQKNYPPGKVSWRWFHPAFFRNLFS